MENVKFPLAQNWTCLQHSHNATWTKIPRNTHSRLYRWYNLAYISERVVSWKCQNNALWDTLQHKHWERKKPDQSYTCSLDKAICTRDYEYEYYK